MTSMRFSNIRAGAAKNGPGSRIFVVNFNKNTGAFRDIHFSVFKFPGGEIQVKINIIDSPEPKDVIIIAPILTSDDLMTLLLLVNAIRSYSLIPSSISLDLPYVPYARQDRVCNPGEALSIKVFAQLINSCNFTSVNVTDPHSDVSSALLDNCYVKDQYSNLRYFSKATGIWDPVFVAPDAGALKKVQKLTSQYRGQPFVRADKTRDPATGKITGTVIYADDIDLTDKSRPIVIVDDICDGGRTFIELAKEIRKLTDNKIILYVSTGIFSQGFDELRKVIDEIWVGFSFWLDEDLPKNYVYTTERLPLKYEPK